MPAIPSNITPVEINKAIQEILRSGVPPRRSSTEYDLVVNGHKFPPKYILSIANKYANGKELSSRAFSAEQAVDFFEKMEEFTIKRRKDALTYHEELERFITQTNTGNLKINDYKKSFADLEVKVSFGQGNKARVPWIAFLNKSNSVQEGVYPVYLFYKNQNLLILSYGVSETHKPKKDWKLNNPTTVSQYFAEHQLGKPVRYGSSLVYKVYDTRRPLNREKIDEDLLDIIDIYKEMEEDKPIPTTVSNINNPQSAFQLRSFLDALKVTGLSFDKKLIARLIGSLVTKPFVILTGLSGSGKTKLTQAFVQWICKDAEQYCIVPVGADWTNREPLLGYPNALNQQEYVKPDNGALDVIMKANHNPSLPYFLILDEMNLSHVERYFADFLSVMESNESIPLYATQEQEKLGIPAKLKWPPNLFIMGTVNIDETTHMFSPKVLDRANTIEFRITETEIKTFLKVPRSLNLASLNAAGASMATHFLQLAAKKAMPTQDIAKIGKILTRFFSALKKIGAEFGYRSATEILQLIYQLGIIDPTLSPNAKLDIAIMQKLLPKLHGSRRKLCPVLSTLGKLCFKKDGINIEKEVFEADDFNYEDNRVLYPLSLEKVTRMYKGAIDNGFASFAEA